MCLGSKSAVNAEYRSLNSYSARMFYDTPLGLRCLMPSISIRIHQCSPKRRETPKKANDSMVVTSDNRQWPQISKLFLLEDMCSGFTCEPKEGVWTRVSD